jgi:outer membrane protein OmpA-like peptidoglycan-associated protein
MRFLTVKALQVVLINILMMSSVYAASGASDNNSWPDENQLKRALMLKAPAKTTALSREWRAVKVEGEASSTAQASSADLPVNFEYKSSDLTTDAQLNLKSLARILNSTELVSQRFKIVGHTDAVGGAAYNQALSERRALSVQAYLVNTLNVESSRLEVEGKGFSELADPQHPTNAINRRVQVINLGQ